MSELRSIPFGRPWITDADKQAVMRILDGPVLTHGPEGQHFEQEFAAFLGGGTCVSVSSCMAALHLSYLALGIGPGDEVIVPAQTHVATAHAVEWVGAKPVFVDCNPITGNVTPEGIARAITPKTRAVSVVHFIGIPCNMREIFNLAESKGLKVVEDCALAVGTRYGGTHVGLFGHAGCFSFYPVKHITTAEGGMFVSRHRQISDKVARLRAFHVDRSAGQGIPGTYDVTGLGLNYRMSEVQAGLGRSQLSRINENLAKRKGNFTRLKERLTRFADHVRVLDTVDGISASSHYCLVAVLQGKLREHRNTFVKRLNQQGVGTSVYYPAPVPKMAYYRSKYGYDPASFINAEEISTCSVALPVGTHVENEDIDYIAGVFEQTVKETIA